MPEGAAKVPDPAPGSGANGPTSQQTRRGTNGARSGPRSCSAAAGCTVWSGQLHGNGRLHRGVGVPAPPSPLARWLGPAARPRAGAVRPRRPRAPSAGGRRGRAAPGCRDPGAGRGRGRERRVAGAPRPWRRRPALLGGPNGAPGCLPWFGPSRLNFGLVVNFKNRRVHLKSGFLTFLLEMRDLAQYGTLGWS